VNEHGQTIIQMESGEQVILPNQVSKVPALFIIDTNQVLHEQEIYDYLVPKEEAINHVETGGNNEPECYTAGNSMSDTFSYWSNDAESLSTHGDGGLQQLHHFEQLDADNKIVTPPDDYVADKMDSDSFEKYKAERDNGLPTPIQRI